MNIYRGCNHGCIYCDSRSECYHIDNFDAVRAKKDFDTILRANLRSKTKSGVVATGSMSDPYNPLEKNHTLTRRALELINEAGFGISIATKGSLVTRDIDLLLKIKTHSPVLVKITVTCADDGLSRIIEPCAPPSSERLDAISELSKNGIFCGLLTMPILPFINDTEENIKEIVQKAAQSGAKFIYPSIGMTLRTGNREYFYKALDTHFKGIKEKYIKTFGDSYQCISPNAKALWPIFASECEKNGILYKMKDIVKAYKSDYSDGQLSLF